MGLLFAVNAPRFNSCFRRFYSKSGSPCGIKPTQFADYAKGLVVVLRPIDVQVQPRVVHFTKGKRLGLDGQKLL